MRPNQRWQSDARDLPWYVKHNGKIYRLCLIIVYDDYSGYIVWWRLILKEEVDIDKKLKKAKLSKRVQRTIQKSTRPRSTTFTAEDVVVMLLTAMYRTGLRPEEIYSDNASQYIKAERLMASLSDGGDGAIIWRHSRPGKPWGRGKVEGALGKLRSLLSRLPGTYNKRDRKSIANAKRGNLYTYEEAVDEVAKHFTNLNERPRKRAPSRFQLWQSVPSLKSPPIRRMAMVSDIDVIQKLVTLDDWSISFDGDQWEPKVVEGQNRRIYRLLGDAIAQDKETWLSAVKLDIGWKVEVQIHGEWVEFVRKSTQQGNKQHNEDQAGMLKDLREEQHLMLAADLEVVKRMVKVLPVQDAASGEYSLSISPEAYDQTSSESNITTSSSQISESQMNTLSSLTEDTSQLVTDVDIIDFNPETADTNTKRHLTKMSAEDHSSETETASNVQTEANMSPINDGDTKTTSPKTRQNRTKRQTDQQAKTSSPPTSANNENTNSESEDIDGLPDFSQLLDQINSQAK